MFFKATRSCLGIFFWFWLLILDLTQANQLQKFESFTHEEGFLGSSCEDPRFGGSSECSGNFSKVNPDLDPLDLKNGNVISAIYELQRGTDLKLLFYFYYGSNSINMQKIVLNPRFYSKYIIIQSK